MASNSRATQINKVLKVVKSQFQPAEVHDDRVVLEHLLFACCLENSRHEHAEAVFQTLLQDYFDWNEVRVTSIRELSEMMKPLNDPAESARRLKRVLQSVFETHYSFDLEPLKKQNIGQTVKQIAKYKGTTTFTVAYVTQNALGGHSIPTNRGLLESMRSVGVISDSEFAKRAVPGLERAIPKSKAIEISSLLHQLGVELYRSPYGPVIRKLLLDIEPKCKDRLPKRPSKKVEPPVKKKAQPKPPTEATKAKSPASAKPKPTPVKKKTAQAASATAKKKPTPKKTAPKKPTPKKPAPKKKVVKKQPAKKKATPKKPTKKTKAAQGKKKSVTKQLKKRKPR